MNAIGHAARTPARPAVWRQAIAFVAALVVWVIVASLLNRLLRGVLQGYAAAEPAMAFTLSMLWARLAIGALASLSAGCLLSFLAPTAERLPLLLGALLLAMFLPVHYNVWDKFPVWYHLLFLLTIIPWVLAEARLGGHPAGATALAS